jgi:NAD(P)-dependent dehydrogenase (short-subunit alcohol dehydrogenase family)
MKASHSSIKAAVVTGGASGIGAAIAKIVAGSGVAVAVADRSDKGQAVAEEIKAGGGEAFYVPVDVASEASVAQAMSATHHKYGGPDILINCAGIFPRGTLADTDVELWDRVMDINLKGTYLCCKAAVPYMIERGGGAIVNIGSTHASVGASNLFAYSISKGAVVTLTRNLAKSLAADRIRVNCVHPGWVASEGEIALREASGHSLEWLIEQGSHMPSGRLQTGEDIAAAVSFLVSDQAAQISGQILTVDGGASVR